MAGGRAGRGRQRGGGSQRRSTSSLEEEETEIEQQSVEESTNDDSSDQGPEIQWTNDGKMILDPAGLWFNCRTVVSGCSASTKQKMTGDVPTCWTGATPQQKEEWFNIFRKSFDWPSGLEHIVRERYKAICTKRYRDLIYKTVRRKKEPEHLKGDAHEGLMKKHASPEFKIKSERGSLNKRGGKKEGIVEATHYGGSRSFLDRVLGKGKKKGKVKMTAPELFADTHSKVDDKGNRHWTKAKDKELHDAYLREKENTPNRPDNDIWFDLVEAYKKGSVYGTGEAHGVFFKALKARTSSKSKQTYGPGIVTVLQAQLDEERRKNAERDQQMREMKAKFDKMEALFNSCNSGSRPHWQDPNDPSGGGGFGAGASFTCT